MRYAKLISERTVDVRPPSSAVIHGQTYSGQLPAEYLASIGYHPLVETDQPGEAPAAGFRWEPRYAMDSNDNVVQTWVQAEEPPPEPTVYSKLKILLAAKTAGFLPDLISMIEADPETKWIWDASNTIEDNELLAAYLPAIAQAIGKTPEEVRAFLDENCLAE